MHDAHLSPDVAPKDARFFVGSAMVAFGYIVALIGCLAFFKIPLVLTFGMMIGGLVIASILPRLLDRRLAFAPRSQALVAANLIGSMLIVLVMVAFSKSNWMTWYFHPAGFQCGWFVLVSAYFHCNGILIQFRPKNGEIDIRAPDSDEPQKNNPYAPPIPSATRTNNPMNPSGGSSVS